MKMGRERCRRGHLYTAETLRYGANGWRRCRICESLWRRAAYRRGKGTEATRVIKSKWSEFA